MKTKHKNCISVASASSEKMKSVILYPYGPLTGGARCCRMLHAKNLAITSAIYTINISLLIVLIYSWRISVNMHKSADLQDVYYGVQIAYFAIIGTQMAMILLSIVLICGICRENPGLIVPWIIGYITFMALEAVAMVYSNVLRDHVNKQFDAMCKAEVAFFIARALINVLAMWGVLRFYNLVRSGITWRGPEAKTAIFAPMYKSVSTHSKSSSVQLEGKRSRQRQRRYSVEVESGCCAIFDFDFDYDDDDEDEDEATDDGVGYDYDDYYDYYEDEDEQQLELEQQDDADCSMLGKGAPKTRRTRTATMKIRGRRSNNNIRSVLINKRHNKYKISRPQTQLEVINESERSAGSGSDENDSLLVAYDSSSSLASV
ncbi:uncharacterized protein LOC6557888 isoform X1 [Drosophila grimshawi]|uniref:uncharacterized protein LOC6557888 isoform X1 n=2 Tax=Drosophila grimshawi TaxID=7222 RepID=UPI000C86FE5C|nr:uncharacterized protein LOC6557888 isoform X1 [Drosophila grimshawi]